MAIFKAKIESEYARIPNKTAQDNRLSFEARGLLTLMLSLPEDWEIHKSWLVKQTSAGRDKITRMLKELGDCGYLEKRVKQCQDGKFSGIDWFVYSKPTEGRVSSTTAKQDDGKPATTKETVIQKKQLYKDIVEQGSTEANQKEKSSLERKLELVLEQNISSDVRQVIETLNTLTKQKLKATTKAHIENISARLKEGHTVEDLEKVIKHKAFEWINDVKMCQYLRPSTLFSTGKFSGYLLAAKQFNQPTNNSYQANNGFPRSDFSKIKSGAIE